jgi:hypothetical protein
MELADVLKHATEKERRLKALIKARELPLRDAIALARVALTDAEDEVRLLAYTMLNVREEGLQGDIQMLTDQLAAAAPECRLPFHRALAHAYWEMVYLGLAGGVIESFMLEAALEHVESAQREAPLDAGLRLLLGRILLRQGKLDQSAMAFSQARHLGIDPCKVAPFLEEIAFMQGRAASRAFAHRAVAADLVRGPEVVEAVEESHAYAGYRAAS